MICPNPTHNLEQSKRTRRFSLLHRRIQNNWCISCYTSNKFSRQLVSQLHMLARGGGAPISSILMGAHNSHYLHFLESSILCGNLWLFLNTTPSPKKKTEKAATYKLQRSQYKKKWPFSWCCNTVCSLNNSQMHIMTKKKNLHKPLPR